MFKLGTVSAPSILWFFAVKGSLWGGNEKTTWGGGFSKVQ